MQKRRWNKWLFSGYIQSGISEKQECQHEHGAILSKFRVDLTVPKLKRMVQIVHKYRLKTLYTGRYNLRKHRSHDIFNVFNTCYVDRIHASTHRYNELNVEVFKKKGFLWQMAATRFRLSQLFSNNLQLISVRSSANLHQTNIRQHHVYHRTVNQTKSCRLLAENKPSKWPMDYVCRTKASLVFLADCNDEPLSNLDDCMS